ncbi:ATP-binding protein [Scytonema tolypothrichoides VB-61278]|nr:ATP-binding protein [Scytonema tolypothrichoides VB-61278]
MTKTPEYCYQTAQKLKQDQEISLQQWQKIGKIVPFELKNQDMSDPSGITSGHAALTQSPTSGKPSGFGGNSYALRARYANGDAARTQSTGTLRAATPSPSFALSHRFLISEKLYGRQHEVETLLAAFDRVRSSGISEMMLVAGAPNVGKTAVVKEVHKLITQQRSYFIQGKCDVLQHDFPLSGLIQAVEDLIGQLLNETDVEIQQWKTKILSALGEQAQIIIDVIPKLELIVGKQPVVTEIFGTNAQNRFICLLHKLLKVFIKKEHPLIIFIDDLQWVDTLTLKFIQLLMSENNFNIKSNYSELTIANQNTNDEIEGGLLLIGAYQNSDVSRTHPLSLTINELKKIKLKINTIKLQELNQANSNRLIADILCCPEALAIPLNQIIFAKTKGNPFLIHQFLKKLYYEGLMQFNFDVGHWECDIAKVRALALTDDVVEGMILQIGKLPKHTQEVLKIAACIGKSFDLKTLSILYQKSVVDTTGDLWAALVEGLVILEVDNDKLFINKNSSSETISTKEQKKLPNTNSPLPQYKFIHDRVQQAAYSLIADSEKQSIYQKIGQLLLDNTPIEKRDEKIFDVVNQFNVAVALITYKTAGTKLQELVMGNQKKL